MMVFFDVNSVTYDKLMQTTQYQKPYRDSGNAYPLGDRRYSARHFRKESDGTFTIWYMHRGISDKVIRGEEVNSYYTERKPLGRVHPDNSFEFIGGNGLHQGERGLLSEVIGRGAHVQQIKAKGGTVLFTRNGTYPVFKGLRISLDTYKPVMQFQVVQPTLNRKRSNEAMKKYREFLDTYPVFLKALDEKSGVSICTDMFEALGEERFMRMSDEDIKTMADNKHYLDAAMAVYLEGSPWIRSTIKYFVTEGGVQNRMPRLSNNWQEVVMHHVNKRFRKMILGLDESVFDWTPQPEGVVKDSTWHHKIIVDGETVTQL